MSLINLKYLFDCNELAFEKFQLIDSSQDFDELFGNFLLVQTVANKRISDLIKD